MKIEIIFIFIFGYVTFCFILDVFGISELILSSKFDSNIERTVLKPIDSKEILKLSKEELGRHTWALLHSIAASYPIVPNKEEKEAIIKLFDVIKTLYPCKICRSHFKNMTDGLIIKNDNRKELVEFICDLHNKVNERLGKEIINCKKAYDVWGGDCGCDVPEP